MKALIYRTYGTPDVLAIEERNKADRECLRDLLEAGHISPVIDRAFDLEQATEATRQVESGHARGKILITMAGAHP